MRKTVNFAGTHKLRDTGDVGFSRGFGRSAQLRGSGVFALTELFDNSDAPVDSAGFVKTIDWGGLEGQTESFRKTKSDERSGIFTISESYRSSGRFDMTIAHNSDRFARSSLFGPSSFLESSRLTASPNFSFSQILSRSSSFVVSRNPALSVNFHGSKGFPRSRFFESDHLLESFRIMKSKSFQSSKSHISTENHYFTTSYGQTIQHLISVNFQGSASIETSHLLIATIIHGNTNAYFHTNSAVLTNDFSGSTILRISNGISTTNHLGLTAIVESGRINSSVRIESTELHSVTNNHMITNNLHISKDFVGSNIVDVSAQIIHSNVFKITDQFRDSGKFRNSDNIEGTTGLRRSDRLDGSVRLIVTQTFHQSHLFLNSNHIKSLSFAFSKHFHSTNNFRNSISFQQSRNLGSNHFHESLKVVESKSLQSSEDYISTNDLLFTKSYGQTIQHLISVDFHISDSIVPSKFLIDSDAFKMSISLNKSQYFVPTIQIKATWIVENSNTVLVSGWFRESISYQTDVIDESNRIADSEQFELTKNISYTDVIALSMSYIPTFAFAPSRFDLSDRFSASHIFTASEYLMPDYADQNVGIVNGSEKTFTIGIVGLIVCALLAVVLLVFFAHRRRKDGDELGTEMEYESEVKQTDLIETGSDDISSDWNDEDFDAIIASTFGSNSSFAFGLSQGHGGNSRDSELFCLDSDELM
jgi:hypothetical protein